MNSTKKITRPTKDYICEAIKAAINSGELAPGEELKQDNLAESFGVSRMPIREALQKLALEGSIERLPNRHMRVKPDNLEIEKDTAASKPGKTSKPCTKRKHVNTAIGKIKLLPAREQVASILRKSILCGELDQGQELTLESIAERLGVSSMPVREAFQILANDGLLSLHPNKGAVVKGVDEKTMRDHYETRALLEGEACARAAAPGVDIRPVQKVYKAAQKALAEGRYTEYKNYNQSWHMAIWKAGGNKKIESILSSLWNGLSPGYLVSEQDYANLSTGEHTHIMAALEKHNQVEARDLMHAHIIRSMENMLTNLKLD